MALGVFPFVSFAEPIEETPPINTVERIQKDREEKDRFFQEDPRSPLRPKDQNNFKGLTYYPYDASYTLSGCLEKTSKGRKDYVRLPTNQGNFRTYVRAGMFRFKIEGTEYVLSLYRSLGRSTLFLPFKDKTNGQETYEHGRYVDVEVVGDECVVVDFNRAYNPYCAYDPRYTCPYASEENTLDMAIRGGEKKFISSP
jgi:uncharacterized protein (DUF1684 family)